MRIISLSVVTAILLSSTFVINFGAAFAQATYDVSIVPGATLKAREGFSPSSLQVERGATVRWINDDSSAHTVTSGAAGQPTKDFDSRVMGPRKEFSFKFEDDGTFDYFCQLHPTMAGTIIVGSGVNPAPVPTTTPEISVTTDNTAYSGLVDMRVIITSTATTTIPITFHVISADGNRVFDTEYLRLPPSGTAFWRDISHLPAGAYKVQILSDYMVAEAAFTYNGIEPSGPSNSGSDNADPTEGVRLIEIVRGATNLADKAYAPNPVKIAPGTTLTWKNMDTVAHTVTSGDGKKKDGMFDSKIMGPKKEYSYLFTMQGTYAYYCELHPTMVGKVVVDEKAPSSPSAPSEPQPNNELSSSSSSSLTEEQSVMAVQVADFAVSAISTTKAKNTNITLRNLSEGGVEVYELTVILSEDSAIKRVKAPRGWTGDIMDNTVIFSTEGRPLEEGKRFSFRLYTASPVASFDWQAYDDDGELLQEGVATARIR